MLLNIIEHTGQRIVQSEMSAVLRLRNPEFFNLMNKPREIDWIYRGPQHKAPSYLTKQ